MICRMLGFLRHLLYWMLRQIPLFSLLFLSEFYPVSLYLTHKYGFFKAGANAYAFFCRNFHSCYLRNTSYACFYTYDSFSLNDYDFSFCYSIAPQLLLLLLLPPTIDFYLLLLQLIKLSFQHALNRKELVLLLQDLLAQNQPYSQFLYNIVRYKALLSLI